MAWNTPRTWTAESVITAAALNEQLRDNLLESAPGKSTGSPQWLTTGGLHSVIMGDIVEDYEGSEDVTTNTSPVALPGGPEVSVTHNGAMLIFFGARMRQTSGTSALHQCGPEVVGKIGPGLARSIRGQGPSMQRLTGHVLHYGMTPGTDTVRMMYWVNGGTAAYAYRNITVFPL